MSHINDCNKNRESIVQRWWRKTKKKEITNEIEEKWFFIHCSVSMREAFTWGHSPDEWVEKKIEQKINGSTFPYIKCEDT